MIRKIIHIDEEKCNGCTLCAKACHEGAIAMVNGKAKLIRDDYCDGLGNCLPVCPTGAITFIEREAAPFDETAVQRNMAEQRIPTGCPGSNEKMIMRVQGEEVALKEGPSLVIEEKVSELKQWPIQIKLIPTNAASLQNAHLLIAADCSAFAYGDFHSRFMKNKTTLIGCPKLDECDYSEKLTEILKENNIKSVTIVRMEVPCCSGIANATITALKNSGKMIPWQAVTITVNGHIVEE